MYCLETIAAALADEASCLETQIESNAPTWPQSRIDAERRIVAAERDCVNVLRRPGCSPVEALAAFTEVCRLPTA